MGVDRLNGRILHGLPILRRNIHGIPILRRNKSVYFEKSSTTTRGNRRTTTFALKFETIDKAEEFEVFWLSLNGSIGDDDAEDRNKMPAVPSTASASADPSSCTTPRLQQANAAPSLNDVASPANTATVSAAAAAAAAASSSTSPIMKSDSCGIDASLKIDIDVTVSATTASYLLVVALSSLRASR